MRGEFSGREMQEQRGKLRRVFDGSGGTFCLRYYKIILPKSAIVVSVDPRPLAVEVRNGRTVLTLRQYATSEGPKKYDVWFLWPERDGTTFLDLPAAYREIESDSTGGKE